MNQIIKILKRLFNKKNRKSPNRHISKNELSKNSVAGFINYATHDYIGARTLLRSGIPGPGTVLAVTALEKIMKAYLLELDTSVRRDRKGHNLARLVTQFDELDNTFLTKPGRKYFLHINKAYKLRYPTEIGADLETFLPSLKILANLDTLFCKVIESPVLDPISKDSKWYDMFKIGAMPKNQLFQKNVFFGADRRKLIESNQ